MKNNSLESHPKSLFISFSIPLLSMIHSLLLTNWRTHRDTNLEFGRGTNLIIGIMGSGKSGLLDGLCYALYGTFPALQRKAVSTSDVFMHGENEAEATVVFLHDGKTYKISRKLRKKDGKVSVAAKITEDGNVMDSGQARVTEVVSEILGMDYDLFTRAVYSEQNNIDYFLTIAPGQRKKEMDRLLGLDRFEDARAAAVSVLNRISSEAASTSSSFDPEEYNTLIIEYKEKKEKLDSFSGQKEALEKGFSVTKKEMEFASKKVSSLEETRKKYELARTTFERTHAKLENLSLDLEGKSPSPETLEGLAKKLDSLSKEKQEIDFSHRALEKELSILSTEAGKFSSLTEAAKLSLDSASKTEKELSLLLEGRTPDSLKELIREKEEKSISISSKIGSLASEITELKDVSATLKPDHSECPLCGAELSGDKAKHIKEEKDQKILKKKEELDSLRGMLPKTKKELEISIINLRKIEQLSERISEVKPRAEKLPELEKKKTEVEEQLNFLKEKQNSLHTQREKIEPAYSDALLAHKEEESLLKKSESLSMLKEHYEKAKVQLDSIKFKEAELVEFRKSLEEARIKGERTRSKLELLKKEHVLLEDSLSIAEKRISSMEKAKKESEYLLQLKEELTIYKNSLLELQSELRSEMTSAISCAMNEIWPVLYPYADYTQIRIGGDEKDYFFDVYDGEWRRLEKVASGGERACLSLTLRMALSTILTPEIGWMMLDEPTHNLDKDAVHTLSEALENKVPEIIPQAIVITHEENLISSEFARSYKFSRDKESLGPTVVEDI